jgi:hypothetical protein
MQTLKPSKLNQIQRLVPEGLLVDAAWLESHGYSGSLRARYVAQGWLEQVARGAYRRPPATLKAARTTRPRWEHAVISLQTLMARDLVVGGRTALELHGFTHYLPGDAKQEIHLYGEDSPPGWLGKLPIEARFVFHNARRLFGAASGGTVQQAWGHWEWPLTLSTPERAVLELLDELPNRETFHQVDVLMEGLHGLSPRRLQTLLAECRSIKVKRLFLWFAERHGHPWLKHLDPAAVDLGHGKRMIVRGGRFDPRWQITVPASLDAGG